MRRSFAARANLASGVATISALALLAVSGWGLYYLGDETWREAARRVHEILGWLLPAGLLLHVFCGRRWRRLRTPGSPR